MKTPAFEVVPAGLGSVLHRMFRSGWGLLALLLGLIPAPGGRLEAQVTNKFDAEILAFERLDRTNPPPANPILFIGSSSIRLWTTLAKDLPDHTVLNRGFGGSEISDSIHFFDRIVKPYQPPVIVLYAGGNDIHNGKSPEQVFADYKAFVAKVHEALPKTRLAYISIAGNPSRWAEVDKVRKANELIREHTRTSAQLDYIDVFSRMMGENGEPKPDIFVADRLHMNAKGYVIWTGALRQYLISHF